MAHMIPVAEYLTEEEAREYYFEPCIADGGDPGEKPEAGWYGRLSAPGYLDCTDWMGPFKTAEEALYEVCEFYEVDEDGEPLGEDG